MEFSESGRLNRTMATRPVCSTVISAVSGTVLLGSFADRTARVAVVELAEPDEVDAPGPADIVQHRRGRRHRR
jgi:hypothetical protein